MSEEEKSLSRRNFVTGVTGVLGGIMGVAIAAPALAYLVSPAMGAEKTEAWIPLGALSDFPVGAPTPFSFTRTQVNGWERSVNSLSVFVIRGADDQVAVLSSRCTHLSCRVSWEADSQSFTCPCHDARFGPQGEVVSGPPPRALDGYETKIEDGALFMRLTEG